MNRYPNSRIREVLYRLKRDWGGRIDIYKKGAVTSDARTGERSVEKTLTVVKRAIILPGLFTRDEIRGISLISANKQMVMGGQYDTQGRSFIVERRDAPNLSLTEDDWLIHFDEQVKYSVKKFEALDSSAWVITAKALVGEVFEQIHALSADNLLDLQQTTAVVPDDIRIEAASSEITLSQSATAEVG